MGIQRQLPDGRVTGRYSVRVSCALQALIGGAAVAGFFVWVGLKDTLDGINSDAAIYVLMADALSPYHTQSFGFAEKLFAYYPFPPLYPALLALLGGGSATPAANYLAGAGAMACAVVASWCWARRSGTGSAAAAAASASLAITPIALFTIMGVFSEPLYLALSMAGFAVLAGPRPTSRDWRVAALLFGLAAVSRGVGAFAVVALLLSWAWKSRGRMTPAVPLLALLPSVLWTILKWANGWTGSYFGSLFEKGLGPVVRAMLVQIPLNASALAYHAVRCLDLLSSRYATWVCALLALLATLTWLRRLRAVQVDALYIAIYLGVLLLWPFPNHFARFLLVLLPLFAAYACWGAQWLAEYSRQPRLAAIAAAATGAVLICVSLPSALLVIGQIRDAESPQDRAHTRMAFWYEFDSQAASRRNVGYAVQLLRAIERLGEQVPASACVSTTMPEMVMLHAHRHALRPPGAGASEETLRAALARCPYVLMLRGRAFPAFDYPLLYPQDRLRNELETISSVVAGAAGSPQRPLAVLAHYRPSMPRAP